MVASAQQTEKRGSIFLSDSTLFATIDTSINSLKSDTSQMMISENSKRRKSKSMEIPTHRDDITKGYTTPVRKMSGKGLAPMPGTDSLDNYDTIPDRTFPPKVIIRSTSEKK
ncbi:hypothetical protein C5749_17505 [Sphingobacterium gobiense]|uniref:Uncharacterized protein n=2 Tax=Sphingobacterium gobiense TaxID=1382456 RepID=A0A2S9JGY0_9SPHI|nr:hypothetical protein C5749_17505 [Sphingobacterium gobiense]